MIDVEKKHIDEAGKRIPLECPIFLRHGDVWEDDSHCVAEASHPLWSLS